MKIEKLSFLVLLALFVVSSKTSLNSFWPIKNISSSFDGLVGMVDLYNVSGKF